MPLVLEHQTPARVKEQARKPVRRTRNTCQNVSPVDKKGNLIGLAGRRDVHNGRGLGVCAETLGTDGSIPSPLPPV